MSGVKILNADISLAIRGKIKLYNWIKSVIISEGYKPGEINIICCSDKYLLEINKRFLNHDYFTDIITFDYSEDNLISGELYISYDRVLENALVFGVSPVQELRRVMIHGVLHLCGYKDKSGPERLKMRQKEDEKLLLIND